MNLYKAKQTLLGILQHNISTAVMLWGAPGIGKSSVVSQVAAESGLEFIDLRLSQLAPTDLRGLPVVDHEAEIARWFAPEFLPRNGQGILFLDEINMAAPTMQGVAQQLILDRRVGSYTLPQGWRVWAAGNRKEDRAAVSTMPAPLANRFIHIEVEADLNTFTEWANLNGVDPLVMGFLRYKPQLLHEFNEHKVAWPSPRSWVVAGELRKAGLEPALSVGEAAGLEFEAFVRVFQALPDLESIVKGSFSGKLSKAPDVRYAALSGLVPLITNERDLENALKVFMQDGGAEDWAVLLVKDVIERYLDKRHQVTLNLNRLGPLTQKLADRTAELVGG